MYPSLNFNMEMQQKLKWN